MFLYHTVHCLGFKIFSCNLFLFRGDFLVEPGTVKTPVKRILQRSDRSPDFLMVENLRLITVQPEIIETEGDFIVTENLTAVDPNQFQSPVENPVPAACIGLQDAVPSGAGNHLVERVIAGDGRRHMSKYQIKRTAVSGSINIGTAPVHTGK